MGYRHCTKGGFRVAPLSARDIAEKADALRSLSQSCDMLFVDVLGLLEHIIIPNDPMLRLYVVNQEEIPGKEAEFCPLEHCFRIEESIYERACHHDGHARFTIAHEIGHYCLHRKQPITLAHQINGNEIPAWEHSEWQADEFARHLLVDYKKAVGYAVKGIEALFEVSGAVAEIVYRELSGERSLSSQAGGIVQMKFPGF